MIVFAAIIVGIVCTYVFEEAKKEYDESVKEFKLKVEDKEITVRVKGDDEYVETMERVLSK